MERDVLGFRISADIKKGLRKQAVTKGETLSEYCRDLFFYSIKSKVPELLTNKNLLP